MIGKTLGHYRILEKLGSGGMGEVYAAEDMKLDRKVALKLLHPELAATPERRSRFEREAKTVAALNHPNIVTLYSVEEAGGHFFLTMELVRGKTLAEGIPKNGLALKRLFELAIPLADAVSTAHQQGVIHRDLKPANLMLSEEGRLKVLDFGLAKWKQEIAGAALESELPTAAHLTEEGRILGTVAYMSPEQAEGKTIDQRTDIFSLGIILYEMASGQRPFSGETKASIMSSILRDTPRSVTEINPGIPRDLSKIIKRCLVKDPERRYQTAKDLRNELEELRGELESGEAPLRSPPGGGRARGLLWAGTTVILLLSIVAGLWILRSRPESMEPTFTQLTSLPGLELFPSLSPDGESFVYASKASGNWDIYQQRVGGRTSFNLTKDSTEDDSQPAFSPDGKQIAFRSERDRGGIFLMGATGESVRRLTDFGYFPAWSPDGRYLACSTDPFEDPQALSTVASQLWVVAVGTGDKRLLSDESARQPQWSPNGHRIAFWSSPGGVRDIWTIPANGGPTVRVTDDSFTDWNPLWSPDGRYLYFSSDRGGTFNIWRVRIDEASGKTLRRPEPVTAGVGSFAQWLSISRNGSHLAYASRVDRGKLKKVAFDPVGGAAVGAPLSIFEGSTNLTYPDPSPDGEWLAVTVWDKRGNIGVIRTDGTGLRKLTDDGYRDRLPRWSPDGRRIAFYSNRSGGTYQVWCINPDGSGLQQLTDALLEVTAFTWSPDGAHMIASVGERLTLFDIGKPWRGQTLQELPSLNSSWSTPGAWSPDGRRVTVDAAHGGFAVYSLETRRYFWLLDVGYSLRWLKDSRRLLFVDRVYPGEGGRIRLMDTETKQHSAVLSLAEGEVLWGLGLSPDNRVLYFTVQTSEADVWLLTLKAEG